MVDILTDRRGWKEFDGEAVVLGVFEPKPDTLLNEINRLLDGAIDHVIKKKEFTGEFGQVRLINTLKKLPCEHVLLIGLGKRDEFGLEQLRRASGIAAKVLRDNGIPNFATTLHNVPAKKATLREQAQAVAEGTILGAYHFTKFKTQNKDKIKNIESVTLLGAEKAAEEGSRRGKIIADCQNYCRDLVNEPASLLTPSRLAEEALALRKLGVKVTVYDKKGVEKLGLNGLLAVSKGSAEEPRFIILEYKKGSRPLVALVGKGLTFDSGGLDLKQPQFMEGMHGDMAGGAAIICAIKALAMLDANANVVGIVPCAENMPGCHAYKPGDLITAYNGKTIEVGNTDAEGRVIIADAIAYAEKNYNPKYIIDLATLTGACVVALGYFAAGLMSREASLANKLKLSGEATGERVWELPMWDDYKEIVKSEVADVKNVPGGKGYEAGPIAGAWFLQHFVENTPLAHIDIAGPAWSIDKKHYLEKGGTGYGVRLLVEFLKYI
ncbi:MAG: leucyl aminopeptidase [Candidatus Woesearchaeota archaeon]